MYQDGICTFTVVRDQISQAVGHPVSVCVSVCSVFDAMPMTRCGENASTGHIEHSSKVWGVHAWEEALQVGHSLMNLAVSLRLLAVSLGVSQTPFAVKHLLLQKVTLSPASHTQQAKYDYYIIPIKDEIQQLMSAKQTTVGNDRAS